MVPTRPVILAPLLLFGSSCTTEYEPGAQARVLTTDPLIDAGTVSVGDRKTLGLELRSEGAAPVTVRDITIEHEGDDEVFVLLPWDQDGDGALELARGTEATPTIEQLQISYRPEGAGHHRAMLSVKSTDTQVEDGLWRVALRGVAQHPCADVSPSFVDFGPAGRGSYQTAEVLVRNCGSVTLTITGYDLGDTTTFAITTDDPVYVEPGDAEAIDIAWAPADEEPDEEILGLMSSDPDEVLEVEVVGNDCEASVDAAWDGDGDGWFACGGDCNDADPAVSPSAAESDNDKDDDCDGQVDEAPGSLNVDDDGDGWSEEEGDCDDQDPSVHPAAVETVDSVDQDCDGVTDDETERYDDDEDGTSEREGDCDDDDASVHPGAEETTPGVDDDCDGLTDEGGDGFDDDGDGTSEAEGDCDDADPWTHPDATEDCDEVDNDCDGQVDEDGACAYLSERSIDTGLGEPQVGCASARQGDLTALAAWLAALGLLVRRRGRRPAG